MNTLQTILALILTPTFVVGGVMLVLRKLFEQLLSRDLEKFKARLQTEFELSKLRLESELQARLFEFQTKFSLYHQKQAEVIGALYEMLSETEMIVSGLVHPVQMGGGGEQKDKIREAENKKVDLARFFERRRIYLDEDICAKMDTLVRAMHEALVKFEVSQSNPRRLNAKADLEMSQEAWKIMEEAVPPIKNALETKFRQILSATLPARDSSQTTQLETAEPVKAKALPRRVAAVEAQAQTRNASPIEQP